jgi:hypothetical protein
MQQWSNEIDAGSIGNALRGGSAAAFGGALAIDLAHLDRVASEYAAARARKRQTERRLLWLQSLWDDPARFDAIVVSGRYLKLCALLEWASDNDETAARRLPQVLEQRVHCAS